MDSLGYGPILILFHRDPVELDTSIKTQNGQNHGLAWKTQFFLLNGICTVP